MTITETSNIPRSLERGLTILDLLAREPGGIRYSDVVDFLGLPNTTVSRLLQALIALQYLEKNREGLYLPGQKMQGFALGESVDDKLLRICQEPMRQLAESSHNSTALLRWTGQHAIFLDRELVDGSLVFQKPGYVILYLHNTPWGIFFLSLKELMTVQHGGPDFSTMEAHERWVNLERERLAKEGYCRGKFIDRRRIAAPIRDSSGTVIGALAIGGTHQSLTDACIKSQAPLLVELARACAGRIQKAT